MTKDQARSLSIIESLTASPHPEIALGALLLEQMHEIKPLLAELLRIAAVPRKFSPRLLSTMTGRQVDDSEFVAAFDALIGMPFVIRRRDGRYRLHDEIRQALLAQYNSSRKDRRLLNMLNERLAEYYAAQHERARSVADQFDLIDALLRKISPNRVLGIRSAVEDQLVRPLIEAQHHRTLAEPIGAGLEEFRKSFDLYENEGRLEVCQLLLRSWQDDIERMPEDTARVLRGWNMYYQARLALAEAESDSAREIIDSLLTQSGLDSRIRAQCEALLTRSLVAECRFADALKYTAAQIAASDNEDIDPWNQYLVFRQQAEIHHLLYDGDAQVVSLHRALKAARSAKKRDSEAAVLNQLSTILAMQGNIVDAAECAIQALHIVRTLKPPEAAPAAQTCAIQMMRTFGARDPRLADLLHVEATQLTRGDHIHQVVGVETAYVTALVGTGQFERGHQVLDHLETRLSDQRPLERPSVLISRANLLDAEGRERQAVERNLRTVKEVECQPGNAFPLAAALTNAATTEIRLGDLLDEACLSASKASELWLAMGHRRGFTLTQVVQAEVNRRRANYKEAVTLLGVDPPEKALGLENLWYWTAADIAADLGRLGEAVDYMQCVADNAIRTGQLRVAARATSWLVGNLLKGGRQDSAVEASERLTELMDKLRKLRGYSRAESSERADEHNGRAVRHLSIASRHPFDALRAAAQHLEEASYADPNLLWYYLNRAYALWHLGQHKSADRALEVARSKAVGTLFEQSIGSLSMKAVP